MVGASESCLVGGTAGYMQWHSRIYGGGLFDYNVKPGPDFVKFKARFGHLVTRLARSRTRLFKARARSLTIISVLSKMIIIYTDVLHGIKNLCNFDFPFHLKSYPNPLRIDPIN